MVHHANMTQNIDNEIILLTKSDSCKKTITLAMSCFRYLTVGDKHMSERVYI